MPFDRKMKNTHIVELRRVRKREIPIQANDFETTNTTIHIKQLQNRTKIYIHTV